MPARGVERWVTQRLSHVLGTSTGEQDGVDANVRFPHPSALVADALARVAEIEPARGSMESRPIGLAAAGDRRRVRAAGVVRDGWVGTSASATRRSSTGPDGGWPPAAISPPCTTPTARIVRRMLRSWADGDDSDVSDDLRWQAELWRQVRGPGRPAEPGRALALFCQRLRTEPDLVDLPRRLSLFGPTRLTTAQLEVRRRSRRAPRRPLVAPASLPHLVGAGRCLPRPRRGPEAA